MPLADFFLIRLINRFVLAHAMICILAIPMAIMLPFTVGNYIQSLSAPGRLMGEGEVIEVRVLPNDQGYSAERKRYWCYLEPNPRFPHYRVEDPDGLQGLKVYTHPTLEGPVAAGPMRLIEVPKEETWSNVYQSYRGRSVAASTLSIVGHISATALVLFLAIGGYFAISGKRSKRGLSRRRTRSSKTR